MNQKSLYEKNIRTGYLSLDFHLIQIPIIKYKSMRMCY